MYQNGNSLEVNQTMFSTFIEYDFIGNNFKINNQIFKASIDSKTINTNFRKINYKFQEDYLITNEEGDDKNFYFLSKDMFLKKYPEFQPKESNIDNKIVFISNDVIKPQFNYDGGMDTYFMKNIPSYSENSTNNNFFKAQFILTKDNKITDIKIINSISKNFDEEFTKSLLSAEKYFRNDSGLDLLIEQRFNFFKMFNSLVNKDEKKLYKISEDGNKYFEINDFQNAINSYAEINSLNTSFLTNERIQYTINRIYINLGISYLAMNEYEKACKSFRSVGDETNFIIRNYLLNFCYSKP
jgi:tetratricopeptide (TPR) repeat protein